jgi:molybdopterin molybdotransferase
MLGMLAAAGYSDLEVIQAPEIALVATGDEVMLPEEPLAQGKLYASNITTLDGWCRRYGFGTRLCRVGDRLEKICQTLEQFIHQVDVVISSGGAWSGDKDLMIQALEHLGWKDVFHGIAMAPGKGVGFGLLHHKPVFMLPGGPSANVMGFLQIALPGLLRLAGYRHPGLPEMDVQLARELTGRHVDWTQFVFGTLEKESSRHGFHPLRTRSRLQAVAMAEAIVAIPEGKTHLPAGTVVKAQILDNFKYQR